MINHILFLGSNLSEQVEPTEEQMKALKAAECSIVSANHAVLDGLIADLEKLTE